MVVADLTAEVIYQILRKHTSEQQTRAILEDLKLVPGNKSFRDSIAKLIAVDATRLKQQN